MESPTVRIDTVLAPVMLGSRYGSVLVLGPVAVLLLRSCALTGTMAAEPAMSTGVASAPFRNERRRGLRSLGFMSGCLSCRVGAVVVACALRVRPRQKIGVPCCGLFAATVTFPSCG